MHFYPFRFLCCALILGGGASGFADMVRLVGSDILQQALLPAVSAWDAAEDRVAIDARFSGTLAAHTALLAGSADLAVIALPDGTPTPDGIERLPFLYQVVTVGVNQANPIRQISFDELRAVFGLGGRVDGWAAFNSAPEWLNRKINPAAIRRRDGVALEVFNAMVLDGAAVKPLVSFFDNTDSLLAALRDDSGMLAILPVNVVPASIRLVPVSREPGAQAYPPTADNVLFGDYALRLPFYLAWRSGQITPQIVEVIRFMLSDPTSEVLSRSGFQTLSANERRSFLLDLE
jgi:ABC-type phosphate transport system substrate-binding protein